MQKMMLYIFGVIVLSLMIVTIGARECKRKNEILPILSVLVFILLGKVLRVLFDLNFVEIILISILYISLLALIVKKFFSDKNRNQRQNQRGFRHFE